MLVKEIMTSKVIVIKADTYIKKIITLLNENKVSGVPVVDENNCVIGVVSEKDILKRLFPDYSEFIGDIHNAMRYKFTDDKKEELKSLRAKDIMQDKVITASPEIFVMKACAIMVINKIRRIPLVDEDTNTLVGIVSQSDVFQTVLKEAIL